MVNNNGPQNPPGPTRATHDDFVDRSLRVARTEELLPVVYTELRSLAAGFLAKERAGHTLQPTALVHEALLRLLDGDRFAWKDRAHFIRVATRAMRRLLVDHARGKGRERRGGAWARVVLTDVAQPGCTRDVDLEALDLALDRLAAHDARLARVVEMRYFAGLTTDETAHLLEVSSRTVELDWSLARAWLHRELSRKGEA